MVLIIIICSIFSSNIETFLTCPSFQAEDECKNNLLELCNNNKQNICNEDIQTIKNLVDDNGRSYDFKTAPFDCKSKTDILLKVNRFKAIMNLGEEPSNIAESIAIAQKLCTKHGLKTAVEYEYYDHEYKINFLGIETGTSINTYLTFTCVKYTPEVDWLDEKPLAPWTEPEGLRGLKK